MTGAGVFCDVLKHFDTVWGGYVWKISIWVVHICSVEAMFKIWLKSVGFEGIKNPLKYWWIYFSLWGMWMFLTRAGVIEVDIRMGRLVKSACPVWRSPRDEVHTAELQFCHAKMTKLCHNECEYQENSLEQYNLNKSPPDTVNFISNNMSPFSMVYGNLLLSAVICLLSLGLLFSWQLCTLAYKGKHSTQPFLYKNSLCEWLLVSKQVSEGKCKV